jgi:phosphoglycolate phosphatase-like HAD superfamily hydrolase
MIGDSLGDVQTARAFGAKSVWCSWGYLNKLENVSADIVLDHPSQLETL